MAENSAVFKPDLKEASQRAHHNEGQVQENIHTEGTAVEKACNKNMKWLLVLKTDKQMMTEVVPPVDW